MTYNHTPFTEIVERIKDILSPEIPGRIYDRHVAEELGLSPNSIRVYKSADYLPLDQLAMFCARRDVSLDWLIFDRETKKC